MHFKIALKLTSEKISRTLISIILAILGIVVIVFTTIQGIGTEYAYKELDKLLTSGFDKTARIRANELNADFLNELAAQPEIRAAGEITSYDVYNVSELAAIQNSHRENADNSLELTTVSVGALNLCRLELQKGNFELNFSDEKNEYLYLGAGFENIPVGTVYETEYANYIVAGILQKGQRFIDSDLSYGFDQNRSDYTFNCDYSVLSVVSFPSTDGFWLSSSDNYTLDQSLAKAFEIAEKHNVEIKYRTLQKSYENATLNVMAVKNIFSKLMPVVCISCVVMILCMQTSDIFSGLRDFGIMYSQGFSQADIEIIMTLKYIITFVISLIASGLPVYWLVNFWYNSSSDGTEVISKILMGYAAPAAVIAIIGIIAVSTVVSLVVLRKFSPVEMIK